MTYTVIVELLLITGLPLCMFALMRLVVSDVRADKVSDVANSLSAANNQSWVISHDQAHIYVDEGAGAEMFSEWMRSRTNLQQIPRKETISWPDITANDDLMSKKGAYH